MSNNAITNLVLHGAIAIALITSPDGEFWVVMPIAMRAASKGNESPLVFNSGGTVKAFLFQGW